MFLRTMIDYVANFLWYGVIFAAIAGILYFLWAGVKEFLG